MLRVSPITLDELTEQHAAQENMGLEELKEVIRGFIRMKNSFLLLHLGKSKWKSSIF